MCTGRIRFWDVKTGALNATMRAPATGRVTRAAASPANALFAVVLEKRNGESEIVLVIGLHHVAPA